MVNHPSRPTSLLFVMGLLAGAVVAPLAVHVMNRVVDRQVAAEPDSLQLTARNERALVAAYMQGGADTIFTIDNKRFIVKNEPGDGPCHHISGAHPVTQFQNGEVRAWDRKPAFTANICRPHND